MHQPHLSPPLTLLLLLQGNHYFERTAVSSPLPCIDYYWVRFYAETHWMAACTLRASWVAAAGAGLRCANCCLRSCWLAMALSAAATSPCACLPACPLPQVVFKPEIVQIWVDNLADLWGNMNLLAADLFARYVAHYRCCCA